MSYEWWIGIGVAVAAGLAWIGRRWLKRPKGK